MFDDPGELKSDKVLAQCYDPIFSVTHPSDMKTIAIQFNFGWSGLILPFISPYF
ncbi:hypothetical protein JVU11DRAFT_12073 [Chiua virens]|nr:hypothetical protein JVU11DRAFT_12073 [Chiua virens]